MRDDGIAILIGSMLPEFTGPGAARARLDEVDGQFMTLDTEIRLSPATVRQIFRDAWAQYFANWRKFHEEHQGWTELALQGAAIANTADRYAEGLVRWRSAFQREGGSPVSPAPVAIIPSGSKGIPWGTLTIAGGVIAGIFAVGYAARSFR